MKNAQRRRGEFHWFVLALLLALPAGVKAQAPDLTGAGVIATVDTTYNYSLGPTGMRGWLYRNGTSYFYGQLAPAV